MGFLEAVQENAPWGRWDLMAISIIVHIVVLLFFISSSFARRRKVDFRSKGLLVGFIIALYFEMYGIPLTLFLLQPLLPDLFVSFYPVPLPLRITGSLLIFAGFVILYLGWKRIHSRGDQVMKSGIYAYVRHPQYVGLTVLTLGQLLQWPTLTGLVIWPFLVLIYYRLALTEEKEVAERFGEEYERYRSEVPAFFPRMTLYPQINAAKRKEL